MPPAALTRREHEVLVELASGDPRRAIARRLGISEDCVKTHLASIYRKLGVLSGTGAVAQGFGRGLLMWWSGPCGPVVRRGTPPDAR